MITTKKKINKIKTQNFLEKFSINLLLQHNNFSVKEWFDFKQKIQEISGNTVEIFHVKNNLLKKSLHDLYNDENLEFLCQGPNFILGCKDETHLKLIWKEIQSNSKLLFISCFYHKKLWNHLDLELFLKTDSSIYLQFLHTLDKKTLLSSTLQYPLQLYPLFLLQSQCITVLESLKESKKEN